MTGSDFKARFHDRCRTNESIYSDEKLTLLARDKQLDIAEAIESVDEGYFKTFEYHTLKATGAGGVTREYPLPDDSLNRMDFVEAKLNGEDWVRLKDLRETTQDNMTTDEETILDTFSNYAGNAYYSVARKSLFLYTGEIEEDVEQGLHWVGYSLPYKVTNWNGTTDLSIPDSNSKCGIPTTFHSLWLDACVIEWKTNRDKPIALTESEQMYQHKLDQKLMYAKDFNRDADNTIPVPRSTTDNGYDL